MTNFIPRLVAFFLLLIIFNRCTSPPDKKITKEDIRGAEKLLGLSYSEQELDTMIGYLEENLAGYDSLRKMKLEYGISPVLYFDPKPDNFTPKRINAPTDWKLPQQVALPADESEIAFMTVAELADLIRTEKISSLALTRIYLNRLKQYNDTLQAAITITEDLALGQAEKADNEIKSGKYRGPLHGIPYGIKDLFAVPGYKTTWGAEPYKDQLLDETAVVAQKLEEAGAVLVAKLTSGALARGDVWFGGKTKNPWDLKQGASGSSAGSGAATAAGLVGFSIGTETLGSILSPSTRCGVTGLRPTYGSVSRAGGMSLSWSMDKVGPICRSAQDCALVFAAIKGRHPENEMDRSVVDYPFSFSPPHDLSGFKVGYLKELFDKDTSKVGSHNLETLDVFRKLGAKLEEVAMPKGIPYDAFDIILRAEAGAFFDELVRSHEDRKMIEQHKGSRANSLRQSRFISAVEYLQANRLRKVLIEEFNTLIKDYDLIIAPTFGTNLSMTTNLSGHPAISIPNGFDKENHPTSITLISNLYDEGPILEAAYLFQKETTYADRHPEKFISK